MKKKIFSTLLLVAFALASTSMFVSCKDYDDDFAKRDADIAALRAELEQRLAQCKANCDAEHAKFLTEHQSLAGYAKLSDIPSLDGYAKLSDIPSLAGYATMEDLLNALTGYAQLSDIPSLEGYAKLSDIPSLAGYATTEELRKALEGYATVGDLEKANKALEALQKEIANFVTAEAIQDALDYIDSLQGSGITAEKLSELMTKVNAIDESLNEYAKISYVDNKVATAEQNLQNQIDALNAYKDALKKENIEPDLLVTLLNKIKDLDENIKGFSVDDLTAEEIAKLKELLGIASEAIEPIAPDLDIIQYMIDKTLSSLVLMPSAYVAGLATIEVPALYYQPLIGVAKQDTENEYYHYFDAQGNAKTDVALWRFDDGEYAPAATIPTWDEGFGWSSEYSGYDYRGEGANNNGEGTMLPIFRKVVEQYKGVLTAKVVPAAVAKYHVNPATVKLDDYTLSFWTNTATVTDEIESRNTGYLKSMAADFAAPVSVKGADHKVKNGILEVPFKLRDWENYVEDLVYYFDGVAINQKTKSKVGIVRDSVNFIALQMTKEKSKNMLEQDKDNQNSVTLTSDYAAVLPALIHINAIADNGPENRVLDCQMEKIYEGQWYTKQTDDAGHMFKWADDAIKKNFTHSVAYNSTLDILPFVETHFTYIGAQSAWASYDQRMDAETFNKMGLHYAFSVVDYENGNHYTGESRHITLDAVYDGKPVDEKNNARFNGTQEGYLKEVILTPRSVSYNKEGKSYATIKNEVANRNAIDREPLIKVEILDENNLKLRQEYEKKYKEWFDGGQKGSAPKQEYKALEVGYIKLLITDNFKVEPVDLTIADNYWMACTDVHGIKWSQIEESILEQLGNDGYTKKQFEDEYVIDRIPELDENGNIKTDEDGEIVYTKYAQRFINNKGWQIDSKPLGDVEYTMFTINDDKDKQTNVIKWAIGTDYERIAKAITGKPSFDAAKTALMATKGQGYAKDEQNNPLELVTTVRFVKKGVEDKYKEMSAIYVTIHIPANQVYFAYGEVKNKDLSHWYKMNSYTAGSEKPDTYTAIDILENIPTPQEWGLKPLEATPYSADSRTPNFERPLLENFIDNLVDIDMTYGVHFNIEKPQETWADKDKPEYYYDYRNNKNIDFMFTVPQKDVNAEFSHTNNTWDVYGISGDKYTLRLSGDRKQIIDQNNKVICEIIMQKTKTNNGEVDQPWIRMVDNDDANDILNNSGRRNTAGDDMFGTKVKDASEGDYPFYLQNNADKKETFTAYLQIVTLDDCNQLLLKNSYFNAKFLRPINVWGKKDSKIDATNYPQEIFPTNLLDAVDWRGYEIPLSCAGNRYPEQKMVPWDFYNIFNVSVDYDAIMTDHAAEKSVRDDITEQLESKSVSAVYDAKKGDLMAASKIQALNKNYLKIEDIPAQKIECSWTHNHYTKDVKSGSNSAVTDFAAPQSKITYTNNGGNVHTFHLFIPVTIQYGWGHKKENTLKVWTVLTIQKTEGSGTNAKKY